MTSGALDVSYDAETGTYRTTHPRHWDLSTTIVLAIEQISGQTDGELPPLQSFINVDALNSLFRHRADGSPRRGGEIRFRYVGFDVHVYHHGTITFSNESGSRNVR